MKKHRAVNLALYSIIIAQELLKQWHMDGFTFLTNVARDAIDEFFRSATA
jgi:hypothetical protein